MATVWDLRPVRAILAECRDLRRQAKAFPSCASLAWRRLHTVRLSLAAIRHNRAHLRAQRSKS